uniref:Uncharacterized protein n=1 Tax=Chromera velia CCMP2878 TaxID=1169474 RepID=A0A0G4FZZ1_9ALVE|eukprot:Cvel_19581.t1-p1 / transcript=Cvel_19581.t1 / gene=Cvel_19581 / organism=Chromera_velia_CCMP2878 / gene_product=hypothetical protein / transcript_product=hypothetical protein / location=Cvel_scaffold1699:38217-40343(-) / protein_length=213 / sequence_SO=supercontig / SO=protein_coding / is_pseudo=false
MKEGKKKRIRNVETARLPHFRLRERGPTGRQARRQTCLVELVDAQQNTYKYADFPELRRHLRSWPLLTGPLRAGGRPIRSLPLLSPGGCRRQARTPLELGSVPGCGDRCGDVEIVETCGGGREGGASGNGRRERRQGSGDGATGQSFTKTWAKKRWEEEDAGEESPSSPMAPVFPSVMVNSEGTSDEDDDDVRGTMKVKNQKWQMKNTKRLAN